jgi:hypothetical protein
MKKLRVESTGFPLTNKTLRFLNEGTMENMRGLAKICGDKTILEGVEVDGTTVSDGYIAVNGELIRFQGGTKHDNVIITTTTESVGYNTDPDDSSVVSEFPAYETKTAQCTSASGTFPFDDLVRLDTLRNLGQAFNWLRKGSLICGVIPFEGFSVALLFDEPLPLGTNYVVLGEFEVIGGTGVTNGIAWSVSAKGNEGFAFSAIRAKNSDIAVKFNYYVMRF